MSDDTARFRKQAEEAREHAGRVISPLDKEAWLRVAEEWLKLAESAKSRLQVLSQFKRFARCAYAGRQSFCDLW